MTAEALKDSIIKQIEKTDDMSLLNNINDLLNSSLELDAEDVLQLTEEQEILLLKAYRAVKNGEFLTNEQANEQAIKWLKE